MSAIEPLLLPCFCMPGRSASADIERTRPRASVVVLMRSPPPPLLAKEGARANGGALPPAAPPPPLPPMPLPRLRKPGGGAVDNLRDQIFRGVSVG